MSGRTTDYRIRITDYNKLPLPCEGGCLTRFHPAVMFLDEIDEPVHGLRLRNIKLHRLLTDVEIHLARRATDIAKIRIGHFSGAIHDTTHDCNLHSFEVAGGGFNSRRGCLEIKQGSSAGGTRYVIGLENACTCCLEDVVGQTEGLTGRFLALNQDRITYTVAKQGPKIRRRFQERLEKVPGRIR